MNVNDIAERPSDPDVQRELREFEADCRAMLALGSDVTAPDDVVRSVDEYIDRLRAGSGEGAAVEQYSLGDQILLLASLWGIQICRQLGWEWVELAVHGQTYDGIVSANREYAILPFDYMKQVVTDNDRENTALLVYNMLKAGSFTPQEPRSYYVLQ